MGPKFDAYYNWLGIPPAEQPPHHYRLLGLAPLESNGTVIEHAADRVMIHLRTFAAGPHGTESQRLLNEVAAARLTLLDAAKKARYDSDLRARLGLSEAGPAVESGPRLPPMPRGGANLPKAAALPPVPVQVPVEVAVPLQVPVPLHPTAAAAPLLADVTVKANGPVPRKPAPGRKPDEISNPQAAAIINVVKIVMGGLGGLSMAVLLVWVVFGIDALGLFGKRNTQQVTHNPASRPVPRPNEANSNPVDPQLPAAKTPDGAVAGGSSKPFSANSTPANPPSDVPSTPENPFQQVLDPTDPAAPSSASPPTSPAATPPETAPSSPASPPRSKRKSKSRPPGFSNPPSNTPGVVNPPAAPPAAANPPTAVDPPATAAVPDPASKPPEMRHPVPSAADQRAKFDEFKSLYSKEFEDAERPPAREKFPDFLIAKADVIKSDPVARFAILREAYNRLIAAKDFATAVELVDRLEEEYQVDALAMRTHTLTKASTAGRQTAAEKQALVLCAADLAEIALRRQRMTQALELSRMADNLSKALQNKPLRDRTIALKEEVEKAQAQWGPVERARQVLATSPDDAAAALVDGRYRCLVAGDWATGIPVLAKGGSDPLAIAARLDLAGAADSKSAATIADAWYELARSDEKLKPLYARALHWYRQAVATSTGADQVPWLQRVELIEGLNLPERYFAAVHDAKASEPLPAFFAMFFRNVSFEPIDCFKFVVPLELKASPWNAYPGSSASIYSKPDIVYGKVPTHVPNIPREYQVGVRVSQYYSSGQAGPFVVGVAGPRSPFAVVIDMPIGTEFCTFITLADAKTPEQNPTLVRYARQHLMFGDVPVLVQVRRGSVTVQIDNQPVTQYEGDLDKLVSPPDWTIPRFNGLLLGAHQGSYRVSSWFLEPVAPAPRTAKASAPPPVPGVPGFPPSP